MKVRATILSTTLLALATLSIASGQTDAPPQPPPPQAENTSQPPPPTPQTMQVRRFIEAMSALANGVACVQGTVKQLENAAAPQASAPGPQIDKSRSTRNTMVLVSAGAASGAAVGAAITKDGRGPMYGAIAGGAAGLIYDLITRREGATY